MKIPFFTRSIEPDKTVNEPRPGLHDPPVQPTIKQMTRDLMPRLEAQTRELQRILAENAKRQRVEDRIVAEMIGKNAED
jgi:hypothetical protein